MIGKKTLSYLAVILLIVWGLGFFTLGLGSITHVLLLFLLMVLILRIIQGRKAS